MANELNHTKLRFMVGEVPSVKNSDSLSVDVLEFVSTHVYGSFCNSSFPFNLDK